MTGPVVLAGGTGDLGARIATALVARGAPVRALVRAGSPPDARQRLTDLGATLVEADLGDVDVLAAAMEGASCVVSALSGLREVIVETQSTLLDAASAAGVPRLISSDFSEDWTKTDPGHNRNLDLRREFAGRVDRAPIAVTSILNGAFMDMIGAEMPIVRPRIRRVLCWGGVDQPLDFTTRDDTAAYTAAAVTDEATPRVLRIAGDTITTRQIAEEMGAASGRTYRPQWAGTVWVLSIMALVARRVAPTSPDPVFPAWQGMQCMVDMFSGQARLDPLDNHRYPDLAWTTVRQRFTAGHLPGG